MLVIVLLYNALPVEFLPLAVLPVVPLAALLHKLSVVQIIFLLAELILLHVDALALVTVLLLPVLPVVALPPAVLPVVPQALPAMLLP